MTIASRIFSALAVAALAVVAPFGAVAPASAQRLAAADAASLTLSSIDVDVTRLRAAGWGPFADIVRETMTQELRTLFAQRIARSGARLVVQVEGAQLTSLPGGGSGGRRGRDSNGGGSETDYLESRAILVGPRGQVVATYPVLSALNASSGGGWYLEDNERNRMAAVARHNAWWIKTQMVGR